MKLDLDALSALPDFGPVTITGEQLHALVRIARAADDVRDIVQDASSHDDYGYIQAQCDELFSSLKAVKP